MIFADRRTKVHEAAEAINISHDKLGIRKQSGIILMDFLEKRRTITVQYYSELLDRFDGKLREIRPHLAKKKVLLHHGNALAHSSGIVAAK